MNGSQVKLNLFTSVQPYLSLLYWTIKGKRIGPIPYFSIYLDDQVVFHGETEWDYTSVTYNFKYRDIRDGRRDLLQWE